MYSCRVEYVSLEVPRVDLFGIFCLLFSHLSASAAGSLVIPQADVCDKSVQYNIVAYELSGYRVKWAPGGWVSDVRDSMSVFESLLLDWSLMGL